MAFWRGVLLFFIAYKYAISFFGALVIGEEAVFLLSILSGRGLFSLPILIVFGFLGLIFADCIWFIFGKTKLVHYIFSKGSKTQGYKKLQFVDKTLKKRSEFLALFLSKFLFGIRSMKIMNLSSNGMKFRKFIKMNVLCIVIWMAIMISLGWLAGQGVGRIENFVNGFGEVVEIIFVFILLMILIELLASKVVKKLMKVLIS
jgi:membrane protein DedA with SNARE-associated domain